MEYGSSERFTTGRERRFASLAVVRFLTVTNDNLVRWLAVGLGKWAAESVGSSPDAARTLGLVVYIAPFLVFATLAGWLADRLSKRTVIVGGKLAEVFIAVVTCAVLVWGVTSGPTLAGLPLGLWLLLVAVGLFGLQSALLNPGLLGVVPEIVPPSRLASANGVLAVVTLAGTMAGMAIGSPLADIARPDGAVGWSEGLATRLDSLPFGRMLPAVAALLTVAVLGWAWSLRLPRVPAADPNAKAPWNVIRTAGVDLTSLWRSPRLAAAATGIVFFWALGAVVQNNIDAFKDESGGRTQAADLPLLIALLVGIAVGSLLAGSLSRRGIEAGSKVDLGFVPLGGILMVVACLALAISSERIFGTDLHPAVALAAPVCWLCLLGIGAGLFDVPLEAYLQEQSPPERRGAVLASTNLLVFAGMLVASTAYYALRLPVGTADAVRPLFTSRAIFGILAVLSAVAVVIAVRAAPRATLRMFVGSIVNGIWRFRVRGSGNVPTEGPLVIVANHLSWLDGFLLPIASPRPVRMVVYGPNIRGRFLNRLADQWRFILFEPQPKSIARALRAIQEGLAQGDCIGIFCEGGISRTGQIMGFKRGLEWLLSRVESPILPASIDGLWGSALTFSEGRYFTKWPRRLRRTITLTFGEPLPAGTHPDQARLALQEVACRAVRARFSAGRSAELAAWSATAEAFDGCCLVRRQDRLLSSLATGDPLYESLGQHAAGLLGIAASTETEPETILVRLRTDGISIWLARPETVEAIAHACRGPSASEGAVEPLAASLEAVVMPIGHVDELVAAEAAAERFHRVFGLLPVVAFAPREVGGLVSMNTPATRSGGMHEVTCKSGTLGRVVNGVVVWPQMTDRDRLGLQPLGVDEASDNGRPPTVVVAATAVGASSLSPEEPPVVSLSIPLAVDAEGFLTAQRDEV